MTDRLLRPDLIGYPLVKLVHRLTLYSFYGTLCFTLFLVHVKDWSSQYCGPLIRCPTAKFVKHIQWERSGMKCVILATYDTCVINQTSASYNTIDGNREGVREERGTGRDVWLLKLIMCDTMWSIIRMISCFVFRSKYHMERERKREMWLELRQ